MKRINLIFFLITIGFFCSTCCVYGQSAEQLSGAYHRQVSCAGCGDLLILKKDSTFIMTYGLDWSSKEKRGTWKIKNHKVHLHVSGKLKTYKLKIREIEVPGVYKLKSRKNLFRIIKKKNYFIKTSIQA